jgi:hypothetical protein
MKNTTTTQRSASWLGNRSVMGSLIMTSINVAVFVTQKARMFISMTTLLFALPLASHATNNDLTMSLDRYKTSDLFSLTLNNKNGNDIIIHISTESKEVVFEQSVRFVEKIKKIYNLSTLPKGKYQFSVSNNSGSTQTITIETTAAFLEHPENGKSILVGFSKITPKKSVNVTIQNKSKQSVMLLIQDSEGKNMKQEDFGTGELVKKEVSFDQIPSGSYVIKVGNKDNQFTTRVTI